ncbi:MAG: phosphoenolpyruvate--protein phosphotransferase [Actinomycetota bacterium]|nr:phosphoenolpyruvate--protein phosphotransferase [Actinomycetota bacterium]
MRTLQGTPGSPGVAVAPAWIFSRAALDLPAEPVEDPDGEIERLRDFAEQVASDLDARAAKAEGELAEVLEAQAMMARDPEMIDVAAEAVRKERTPAARAVVDAGETYAEALQSSESEYMAARASDVRDVCERIARRLVGADDTFSQMSQRSVVVADELPPADVGELNRDLVAGIATAQGSRTSHTAIVARALGIPAVVGLGEVEVDPSDEIAVDGDSGQVFVQPDEKTRSEIEDRASRAEDRRRHLIERAASLEGDTRTRDGHRIEVAVNVATEVELKAGLEAGAEGVGLFRTELLYLDRTNAPSRAEQSEAVRSLLGLLDGKRLVIRTFDFGADKPVPFLNLPSEENPAMGVRGVRLARDQPELLDDQLAAIADAASTGDRIAIMAPMVATSEEARWFVERVGRVEMEAEVGVMVEVPAAVFMAEEIAEVCDFLSIGTNDLTQYLFAADRQNGRLGSFQDHFAPALLRAVKTVCDAADDRAWVGVCGEAAADPLWAMVATGLGVEELSMGPEAVLEMRVSLSESTMDGCRAAADAALQAPDAAGARRAAEDALG